MKEWNLKVKSSVEEVAEKLDASFGSVKGFVFNMKKDRNGLVTFKLRKRGMYAFQILYLNRIVANGKIAKADAANESNVEILFSQDILVYIMISVYFIGGLGLLVSALFFGISNNINALLVGVILLTIGISLWFDIKRRFEKNIQKYKKLFAEVLDVK
ncbi:DUF423 domain-containing protein [Puteibacter caeruleilacunae]|nr:DUF423 domain-containing protein [Puteibacter caeruleilacunae]